MVPRGDLTSTGYALANPGTEYLILQPVEGPDPISAQLVAGTYLAEWFSVGRRETVPAGTVTADSDRALGFTPPFAAGGPSVLYLKRVDR